MSHQLYREGETIFTALLYVNEVGGVGQFYRDVAEGKPAPLAPAPELPADFAPSPTDPVIFDPKAVELAAQQQESWADYVMDGLDLRRARRESARHGMNLAVRLGYAATIYLTEPVEKPPSSTTMSAGWYGLKR